VRARLHAALVLLAVLCGTAVLLATDTTTFSDNFNRADENPLSGGGVWSGGYTSLVSLLVTSNTVSISDITTDSFETVNSPSFSNDQWGQVTISTLGSGTSEVSIGLRFSAPATWSGYLCLAAKGEANSSRIVKITTGTGSDLATDNSATWAATDTILCETQGTALRMYRNGGLLLSTTDGTYASGRIGLDMFNDMGSAQLKADNYSGGDITGSGRAAVIGSGVFSRRLPRRPVPPVVPFWKKAA
jgi:hypothetical protein